MTLPPASTIVAFPRQELIRRKPLKHDIDPSLRRSRKVERGRRGLTVCIAAIAERARAIVLVADRAVSMERDGQTVLKADSGVRKIRELHDGWAGMIAGPIDFGERVLNLANENYLVSGRSENLLPKGMPECVTEAFQICRHIEAVDRVLRPRGVDDAWYKKKVAGIVRREDSFFADISRDMREFLTRSVLLVCGFENCSPEIYLVCDPGVLHSESAAGFGVAGTGEDAAKSRLFTLETDPSDCLEKVLYDAYDAKDSCYQLIPEVGEEWDGLILVNGKNGIVIPNEIQVKIEKIYKGHSRSPFDRRSVRPSGWKQDLRSFSQGVMLPYPTPSLLSKRSIAVQRDC